MSNNIKDVKEAILKGACAALNIGENFYAVDKLDLSENANNFTGYITLNGADGSFTVILPKMSKTMILWKCEAATCRKMLNFILNRYNINKQLCDIESEYNVKIAE